jgi:hypothetical protein
LSFKLALPKISSPSALCFPFGLTPDFPPEVTVIFRPSMSSFNEVRIEFNSKLIEAHLLVHRVLNMESSLLARYKDGSSGFLRTRRHFLESPFGLNYPPLLGYQLIRIFGEEKGVIEKCRWP